MRGNKNKKRGDSYKLIYQKKKKNSSLKNKKWAAMIITASYISFMISEKYQDLSKFF